VSVGEEVESGEEHREGKFVPALDSSVPALPAPSAGRHWIRLDLAVPPRAVVLWLHGHRSGRSNRSWTVADSAGCLAQAATAADATGSG
jgi:hypothetical protein